MENRNVVIFAGAGASKAVDPKMYPTTVEFFERLPAEISTDRLFQFAEGYLRRDDPDRLIDIEEILWTLSELRDFLQSTATAGGLIGYALKGSRLAHLTNSGYNFGHIEQIRGDLLPKFNYLISSINSIVYDFYGDAPPSAGLKKTWLPLLKPLFNGTNRIDIFTTNYDINLETAIEATAGEKASDLMGLAGGRHKIIDLSKWEEKNKAPSGLLTKLHGSVDWKLKGEKIYVGDPVFTGDHAKQGIIYPGFKGTGSSVFFKPFHDYFERSLAQADFVAFIGFAFRDEYINRSIANNLSPTATVMIVNPAAGIEFPARRARLKHIPKPFDASTATDVANTANSAPVRRTRRLI